jgi:hypothetical protein
VCWVEESGEKIGMVGPAWKRTEPSFQFTFNEQGGPVGDPITNIEIHVMNLNVSQVMGDGLGHRFWASSHLSQSIPHLVIERIPSRLQKYERTFEVIAEFDGGPVRACICGDVCVVPNGMESADLARCRTP